LKGTKKEPQGKTRCDLMMEHCRSRVFPQKIKQPGIRAFTGPHRQPWCIPMPRIATSQKISRQLADTDISTGITAETRIQEPAQQGDDHNMLKKQLLIK